MVIIGSICNEDDPFPIHVVCYLSMPTDLDRQSCSCLECRCTRIETDRSGAPTARDSGLRGWAPGDPGLGSGCLPALAGGQSSQPQTHPWEGWPTRWWHQTRNSARPDRPRWPPWRFLRWSWGQRPFWPPQLGQDRGGRGRWPRSLPHWGCR